ncbi:RHS repeat-associated core domain-containing protein [Haloechinothrix halophila]|uniref:RHS repeat-associated core domain-containing protein n=1 Tax=Haloechinothrix halophila TaxID=1069073 RepID=UPI00146FA41F|nr:RHS repeat-associated core domain-containing protein [Haloechinothrix halophila]
MTVTLSSVLPAGAEPVRDADRSVPESRTVPHKKSSVEVPPVPEGDGEIWKPSRARTSWPAPGVAKIAVPGRNGKRPATAVARGLALGKAKAGGVPVSVAAAKGTPTAVRVRLLDRSKSKELGVSGPVFTVTSLDGSDGEVELSIDYTGFAGLYGAEWVKRARLVRFDCESDRCGEARPLTSANDRKGGRLSARVPVKGTPARPDESDKPTEGTDSTETPSGGGASTFSTTSETTTLAVSSGDSSEDGDYKATDLSAAGSWEAGGPSGAFTYSVPMRTPPAEGVVPQVGLNYNSQSIDGKTSGKNNQAPWTGDGWNYSPGFIERSYKTCLDDQSAVDGQEPNNADKDTADLCWAGQKISISLNGTNGTLVKDATTGKWRVSSDNNWRVQKLTDDALTGYDNSGEYWKVTTPDGTKYFFGRKAGTSKSTWVAPVFGNHPGEPCHATSFKDSSCKQAWRWMLDKAVDVNGNITRYYYQREFGHYGAAGDENNRVTYNRGGFLKRIAYGKHSSEPDTAATGRVLFTAGDRCFSDCYDADGDPKPASWPDVPWDQDCDATPCTDQVAPTFWTAKRLAKVTTQVWRGSSFSDVESWTLKHEFRKPGDGTTKILWLRSVTHAAHVGSTLTSPPITFTPVQRANRVDEDKYTDAMVRLRLSSIRTESGADIHVTYSGKECTASTTPKPSSNAKKCYPVYWTPKGQPDPVMDWFHKYVVTQVTESDLTVGAQEIRHDFKYATAGGGTNQLWAYDTNEFTKKKHRTYSMWRGYPQVIKLTGDPTKGQLKTRSRFYRGMHGQPLPDGTTRSVSVTDSEGNTATDHRALTGLPWEQATYNGTTLVDAATHKYWKKLTAKRSRNGVTHRAFLTGESAGKTRKRLASDAWQRTAVYTTFNDEGQPIKVNDLGEVGKSGDEKCTRNTYVGNSSKWLRGLISRSETVSVSCGATPTRPKHVIEDTKTFYDGSTTHGSTPTKGRVTRADEIDKWNNGPVYLTVERTNYDKLGRVVTEYDAKNRKSTTAYTPTGAGPVTKTVKTNPLGHTTTTHQEPAFAEPTAVVDANSKRTDLTLDPMGRLTKVWLPSRDKGSESPNMEFSYTLRNDGPLAVTTKQLQPAGNYSTEIGLFDSLYRPVQTQEPAVGGGRLVTHTVYNERGEVATAAGPNHTTGDPSTSLVTFTRSDDRARTEYTYDNVGRERVRAFFSRDVEQRRTTTTYGGNPDGWQVAVDPPDGDTATAEISNVHGNVVELRQFHDGTTSGMYDATTYTYTPRGDLKTVVDPMGHTWRHHYDLRGREVKVEDPDKGTSTTVYDATDQVIESTDALGRTVSTTYDELDRPTARYEGSPSTGTKLAAWVYDTVEKGHVTRTSSFIDGNEFYELVRKYDDHYNPVQTGMEIPSMPGLESVAGRYLTTASYLDDGSLRYRTLPAVGGLEKETLAHAYDDWGNVGRITATDSSSTYAHVYLDDALYTPYGEIAQRTMGVNTSSQVQHTYVYEEATRRVSELYFDRDGTTVPNVAHLKWSYDAAGNVLSLADTPEEQPAKADVQCFGYDYLRRMTEAWSQGSGGCADSPSTEVMGGVEPYWNSYEYRKDGSRSKVVDHQTDGSSVTSTYNYPAAGEPQPRAVRSVTTGTETDTYDWDAAGNLTSRTRGGETDAFTWNAAGKPESIDTPDGTAQMYYGAHGDRLVRKDADGGVTAFVFGQELTVAADGTETGTRYYNHGDSVIATRTTGGDLTWLASDHHGTADWAINSVTMNSSVKRRDPFGGMRGHDDPSRWPGGQRSFVGGVDDPTGLIQLGARSYDPQLGMFLTVDPKTDEYEPQRMHPYSYSNNAPLTFTDPQGLFWEELTNVASKVSAAAGTVALATAAICPPVAAAATVVATTAAAVEVTGNLVQGNHGDAAFTAVTSIPGLRQASAAVRGFKSMRNMKKSLKAAKKDVRSARNMRDDARDSVNDHRRTKPSWFDRSNRKRWDKENGDSFRVAKDRLRLAKQNLKSTKLHKKYAKQDSRWARSRHNPAWSTDRTTEWAGRLATVENSTYVGCNTWGHCPGSRFDVSSHQKTMASSTPTLTASSWGSYSGFRTSGGMLLL